MIQLFCLIGSLFPLAITATSVEPALDEVRDWPKFSACQEVLRKICPRQNPDCTRTLPTFPPPQFQHSVPSAFSISSLEMKS